MKKLVLSTLLIIAAAQATAGEYDFSYNDINHLRGSYQACEKMGFNKSGPDCPKVYTICWSSKWTYHSKGKLKTKCKQASSFSGTEQDGNKAINDGNTMLKTPS